MDTTCPTMVSLISLMRPFVVGVVVEQNVKSASRVTNASFRAGADSVELNLAPLRNKASINKTFFSRHRHPIYTAFRRSHFMAVYGPKFVSLPTYTDEERMAGQISMLSMGSAGIDIEADTFAPNHDEWSDDRSAIRQQRAVANTAHQLGAAVIWSWHPPRKLTLNEALRAAKLLRDRGADFVKIVERVSTRTDALNSVAISLALRDKLQHPYVFLALGKEAGPFRPFMTAFGAAYLLARPPVGENQLPAHPAIAQARAIVTLK